MAISFVGSSNVANGLVQGTSAVVPRPAGVANGDRLLVFISIGSVGAITPPAGWSEVVLGVNTAPNLQNRIYTKVASSEPVSWTWTFASSAYVGICHATRDVGGVVAANQSDDGLSLLSHTTPTLAAPVNAWLVSSWTGRNLLALGWGAPAGDVERQDVVGGLLVLLNVNHAIDDTNAGVVAGNHSKTAATLLAVRALCALVVLAPILDPVQVSALKSPVSFGGLGVEHNLTLPGFGAPVDLPELAVQLSLAITPLSDPVIFGLFGIDSEVTLDHQDLPVVQGEFDLTHEILLFSAVPAPIVSGTFGITQEITDLGALAVPVQVGLDMVLPESTVLLMDPLPIPVIAGSGGILSVFRTFILDPPGLIDSPVEFGKMITYMEFPYGGNCC